ncbi:helix-turn-helix domain-containing protein [Brevifollis gellanilyticus]|uniref:helix-turn-helix domain-containing protein n=1 Tax=Brevifollis gellanilyticus TaxID=748831 RepID=UPI0011BE0D27
MSTPNNNNPKRGLRPLVVSIQNAAQLLDVSEKTVRRLIEKGVLKPTRVLRILRIPVIQIQALINGDNPTR